jgi:hypothetical protein
MKKLFSEAEVELTLLSALEDILSLSGDGSGLGDPEDGWDEWN